MDWEAKEVLDRFLEHESHNKKIGYNPVVLNAEVTFNGTRLEIIPVTGGWLGVDLGKNFKCLMGDIAPGH